MSRVARKKSSTPGGGQSAALSVSRTDKELRELFGDGCLYSGGRVIDEPPAVISWSPRLDQGLGGGILEGTLVTLAGDAGCGKTTTAIRLAAQYQKAGRQVYYASPEGRLWEINFRGVDGIRPDDIKVIGSSEGHILNAQDYLRAIEVVLRNETDTLVIIDSISILCEEGEMNAKNPGEGRVGGASLMVGSFLKRMAAILPINRNVLVAIAQVYTNIGGKKKYAVSMPVKIRFARATGLFCEWAEPINSGDEQVGQIIHWKVERSPLSPPGAKIKSILRYGVGIDEVGELADTGREYSLIKVNGSWSQLAFLGEDGPKLQGADKVREYLIEHPEDRALLEEKLRYYLT